MSPGRTRLRVVEAARNLGQPEEGLEVLAEALALVENTGERYMEAELYRLRGELLLEFAPDDHGPADTPSPLAYLEPRLFWASASPCSAALRYHFTTSATFLETPRPSRA